MVGCASIVNETTQPIKVDTLTSDGKSLAGAECTLANDFTTATGKSGGTVSVHRSSKDLDISCAMPGQPNASGRAISRANAGMAGNILIGGGIGAIIDHTKGTAYTYPTWVQLVFGQTQVFDRKNEKDGQVVLGQKSAGTLARAVPTVASAALGPQPAYLATGYARIDDVDAVPLLGDRGREKYREFLTKPTPRAFAIGPEGQFSWANGLKPLDVTMPSNPSERVLLTCERIAKVPCTLYAVNGAVVWAKGKSPAVPDATSSAPVAAIPTTPIALPRE